MPDAAVQLAEQPGASVVVDASAPATRSACDLSGRWVITERFAVTAAGARQVSVNWLYAELTQVGDALTFSKSLHCGDATVGLDVKVRMDDSASWPAFQKQMNYNGRKGTSVARGGGCDVNFDNAPLVHAMTTSAYAEQSVELPTLEQRASGSVPGWEDWDEDGKPGLTMNVTGDAAGKLYTAFRTFTTATGSIAASATSFRLEQDWVQERVLYGFDPPTAILITTPGYRVDKPGANFVQLTRLSDEQAVGDDDATCQAIRELVSTLTPEANEDIE